MVTTENWWLPASLIRQTIRIHKITPGGSLIWSQRYVYQDDETRFTGLRAVRGRATADGGCVVVGNITGTAADSAYSNLYLLKVAPDGARQWELLLGTPDEDEASDVLQLPGGGYLVSATAWAYPAQGTPVPYMYAAQLSADGTATRIRQPDPALAVAVQPNPFGARLALRLSMEQPAPVQAELLDLQGRIVRTIRRPAASGQHLEFDTESLPAGAYLLRVHAGGKTWSSTVVRQ
ncbi:MAG: T9SS type A sorting domain-containing protein [Bacteroidia bacterium]|nr:T9SS type A sorting domain-containing protein [Bacteroidia bacterium]